MRRLLLAALLVVPAIAGSWVNHAGNPQRNCISDVSGPAAPTVLWQGTLPSSFGQPVLIDGNRLVTYRDNFTTSILVCHDLETGDTLWTLDFPGTGGRTLPAGMRDGRVYVVNLQNTAPDTLFAFDADDGTLIWRCRFPVSMYLSESATFTADGDLIVPLEGTTTARINHLTGDTVWTTLRVWPVSGSADCTVGDSNWYCFGGALIGGRLRVYKFSVATGQKLDSTFVEDTHPRGSAPYGNIIVGPDRVLYCHRCGDNVTAIENSGDSLHIRWVYDVGESLYSPFAQLACGPDSSVYALAHGRIMRLDPLTGTPRDSSPFIKDPAAVFAVHMAVGADGTVYATNAGYSGGALFAFTPELEIIWAESTPNISTSNPAIGPNGELAIAGSGTDLRVYRDPTAVRDQPAANLIRLSASPNPFRSSVSLSLAASLRSPAPYLHISDATGRRVRSLVLPDSRLPTPGPLVWDGRDFSCRRVPAGAYFVTVAGHVLRLTVSR